MKMALQPLSTENLSLKIDERYYLEIYSRIIAISLYSNEIEVGLCWSWPKVHQIKKLTQVLKPILNDKQLCFYTRL